MSTTEENTSANHGTNPVNKTSSMNNTVIPLVLFLVAVIVIVATFYENEEKDLVAQNSTGTDDIAVQTQGDPEIIDKSSTAEVENITDTVTDTTNTAKKADDLKTVEQSSPSSSDDIAVSNTESAIPSETTPVASPNNDGVTSPKEDLTVADNTDAKEAKESPDQRYDVFKSRADQNRAHIDTKRTTYQNNQYAHREVIEQARQKTMVIAREQAKKRDELMQQQRLAFEQEMQERRRHYEAAKQAEMKAREERRTRITDTQKAVYQRTEQNRNESNQRLQEMHKQLSEMHDEIHQMIRDSHQKQKSSAPVQVQAPSKEQI